MRSRPLLVAMLCAGVVAAEFVGGKATRDALFLTSLSTSALPAMLIATALVSILMAVLDARALDRLRPNVLVPVAFAISGVLFLVQWAARPFAPSLTAVTVYLHVSGAGPLLASGFWLLATDRFNPRTAKARFGQIGGAGTFGGLLGAVVAERVAVHFGAPAMLLVLASLQFVAAWLVWVLASTIQVSETPARAPVPALSWGEKARLIAEAPHLRDLMSLVLLGTTGAALVEYMFRARAVDAFGTGDGLLRFFALFYGITSFVSLVIQVVGSRAILKRGGLGLATSSPSFALLAGSIGSLVAPGFGSLVLARGGEAIFRASWFRAGYEQFFTPMQLEEKRTAKPFIDVVLDRLGDAVGGGIVRLVVVFVPVAPFTVILLAAAVCGIGGIVAASHLNRWYRRTLENSLVTQGGDSDWPDADSVTLVRPASLRLARITQLGAVNSIPADREVSDTRVLRHGDRAGIIAVLSRADGLTPALIPHVVPLLANSALAEHVVFALRKVAEEHVGALTDALLDPRRDPAVRRRLARVFSICVSQRAADGLALALDDPEFDVRYQAARSLAAIVEKNPLVRIDRIRIERVVRAEAALLDDRSDERLEHAFTLLSLVLPPEPLRIAFRGLSSVDGRLRGTALEYLGEVLPPAIRHDLWPSLARKPRRTPSVAGFGFAWRVRSQNPS